MLDHVEIQTKNVDRCVSFYRAVLAPVGYAGYARDPDGRLIEFQQWREHAGPSALLLSALARGAWDFKWPLGLGAFQATIGEEVAAAFDEFELGTRRAMVNLALGPALHAARRLPAPLLLAGVVTPAYLEQVEPIEAIAQHAPHLAVPFRAALHRCRQQLEQPRRPPLRPGDRTSVMRELAYAWVDELGTVRAGPLRRLLGMSRPGFARLVDSMNAADALRSRPHAAGRLWSVSATYGARQRPRARRGRRGDVMRDRIAMELPPRRSFGERATRHPPRVAFPG